MVRRPLARTWRAAMLLVIVAPLATATAQRAGPQDAAPQPPQGSMYALPSTWTAHDGRAMDLSALRGEVVVVGMVYTSCTMTCPLITNDMLAVQRALPANLRSRVRFVLASFDPARDSVPVLRAYAKKMSLDARWLVMRASPADVRQLAVLMGVSYRLLPSGDFDHSNIITVLDAEGVPQFRSERIPIDRPAMVGAVVKAAQALP